MRIVPDFCIFPTQSEYDSSSLLKNMRLCVTSEKQGQITKIFSDNRNIFY